MDNDGMCDEFRLSRLTACSVLNFHKFTQEMLTRFCVLAGCDYLTSPTGVGIKTAHKLVREGHSIEKVTFALLCILPLSPPFNSSSADHPEDFLQDHCSS